eukprot:PhF_6_TR23777/c0_g1_i1/m.33260
MSSIIFIVRHGERSDRGSADARRNWAKTSPPSLRENPTLTPQGHTQALATAYRLHQRLSSCVYKNHRISVVSSPYVRCVQTASHLCSLMDTSSSIPISIEPAFGELQIPSIFPSGPPDVSNPLELISQYVDGNHTLSVDTAYDVVGGEPKYPEKNRDACQRAVDAFLTLADRITPKSIYVIYTHAFAVEAIGKYFGQYGSAEYCSL